MNERIGAATIAASLIAWGAACGPAAPPSTVRALPAARAVDAGATSDAGIDAGPADARPSLDAIAQRSAAFASGMREIARREVTGAHAAIEIVRAEARDACVRVAYSANAAVSARIVDDAGAVLAERTDAEGLLAARGPVCVRRGGALRVTFDGPPWLAVRFVAWVAP